MLGLSIKHLFLSRPLGCRTFVHCIVRWNCFLNTISRDSTFALSANVCFSYTCIDLNWTTRLFQLKKLNLRKGKQTMRLMIGADKHHYLYFINQSTRNFSPNITLLVFLFIIQTVNQRKWKILLPSFVCLLLSSYYFDKQYLLPCYNFIIIRMLWRLSKLWTLSYDGICLTSC